MKSQYSTVLKASIPLALFIAGGIYLRNTLVPKSDYNPRFIETPSCILTDADRDGDVDIIQPKNQPPLRKYVASDMVQFLKDKGDTFIDYMHLPAPITSELQDSANKVLKGEESDFEKLLEKAEIERWRK